MLKKDLTKKINIFNTFFLRLLKKKKNTSLDKIFMKNEDEWDSINHLNIIFKIESIFDTKIKASEIEKLNSYIKILQYAKKKIR